VIQRRSSSAISDMLGLRGMGAKRISISESSNPILSGFVVNFGIGANLSQEPEAIWRICRDGDGITGVGQISEQNCHGGAGFHTSGHVIQWIDLSFTGSGRFLRGGMVSCMTKIALLVNAIPAAIPAPPMNKSRLENVMVAPSLVTTEAADFDMTAAVAILAVSHLHAVARKAP